jgi:hypothetical protein
VLAADDDTLIILLDGRPLTLMMPRSAISSVATSRGRGSRVHGAFRGAGIGILAGGAAGALVGVASGDDLGPLGLSLAVRF